MLIWFTLLGVLGAMNIGEYFPILQAFNPLHAVRLLASSPEWFLILGAVSCVLRVLKPYIPT